MAEWGSVPIDYSIINMDAPWGLFSSIMIGIMGTLIFFHGKKELNFRCLLAGLGLCIFPYFVTSVALMWSITGATMLGLYVTRTDS